MGVACLRITAPEHIEDTDFPASAHEAGGHTCWREDNSMAIPPTASRFFRSNRAATAEGVLPPKREAPPGIPSEARLFGLRPDFYCGGISAGICSGTGSGAGSETGAGEGSGAGGSGSAG